MSSRLMGHERWVNALSEAQDFVTDFNWRYDALSADARQIVAAGHRYRELSKAHVIGGFVDDVLGVQELKLAAARMDARSAARASARVWVYNCGTSSASRFARIASTCGSNGTTNPLIQRRSKTQ